MTRQQGGLGLGLSIVRHLVELHGGNVQARSPGIGKGADLHRQSAAHRHSCGRPRDCVRRHPSARIELSSATDLPHLNGVSVVLFRRRRSPTARELVRRLLEECGATVTTASSAAEALELVASVRPDVLVSDIGMPHQDGYELLRKLRRLPDAKLRQVPAVALTAFARSEDRLAALHAGYQMHVAKPVEPAELIASVASLAGRFHSLQE